MPRRKITKSDMPKLTEKQKKFCAELIAGKTQRQAYKAAYDVQAMSDAMVDCEASRLRNSPKIALWLDAIFTQSANYTLDEHRAEMQRLKAIAIRTGNVGAAVQAEQLIGKASGHYVEQYADVTPLLDPRDRLKQIAAKYGDDFAATLAAKHGLTYQPEPETRH